MADISYGDLRAGGPSFLDRVLKTMENIALSNPRLRQIERLSALSDEQLAARGLRREDIVRHVFRDVMCI